MRNFISEKLGYFACYSALLAELGWEVGLPDQNVNHSSISNNNREEVRDQGVRGHSAVSKAGLLGT